MSPSASVGDFRLRGKKSSTAPSKIALRVEASGGTDPPDGCDALAGGGPDPPGGCGPDPPDCPDLPGGGPDPP